MVNARLRVNILALLLASAPYRYEDKEVFFNISKSFEEHIGSELPDLDIRYLFGKLGKRPMAHL